MERIGADIYSEQDKYKENIGSAALPTGRIIERNLNFRQFNHDLIINAHKEFGDFNVELLLGNKPVFPLYPNLPAKWSGTCSVNGFDNISAASTITATEDHSQVRKVGFYAQSQC